eukprot:6178754-Pleurochrysis_carterae.AAC.5
MGDAYLCERGCYDGVYETSGVIQRFCAEATVGGRVMCAHNTRYHHTSDQPPLADFDANSLYPSAMIELPQGIPMGKPKIWNKDVDLTKAYYVLEVKILSMQNKSRAFPAMRVKTEGGCNWTNDLIGRNMIIDRCMLEDLCEFKGATYEIKQGHYWDDFNSKLSEVMMELYENRLRYKTAENPIQLIFKLLMNSSYGITGLKPVDTDTKYIENTEGDDTQQRFISQNYDQIKYFTDLCNGSFRYVLAKETVQHFNRQHVACMIPSFSKRIMNRLMYLSEDSEIQIYYQDTDSMHLPSKDVERLAQLYKEKYRRTLIGNNYGQFSSDFETSASWIYDEKTKRFRKAGGDIVPQEEVIAKESVFLGKKSYLDVLSDDSQNSFTSYHIRMKGIPTPCILHYVQKHFNNNVLAFYKSLYNGDSHLIDLNVAGNCCFKINRDHTVKSYVMARKIHFPSTR